MRCSSCQSAVLVLAHRGAHQSHSWEGKTERQCTCRPIPLCTLCDVVLIQEHGFLLLDDEALPDIGMLN